MNTLPPYTISLQTPGKFSVVVCYVIDPSNFYIHPVQESGTKRKVDTSLFDCVSDYCHVLVAHEVGELCCVKSAEHSEWCRGLVTDVKEYEDEKEYLVCHIDYGDSDWYKGDQLKAFTSEFLEYPAQAVHCCLSNVHPTSDNHVWKEETIEQFKKLTTRSQLVAFIKSEG